MALPIIIFNFSNEEINESLREDLRFITLNSRNLCENLNNKQFNDNKLYGTAAAYFTNYDIIVVNEPNEYISKGANRLLSDIKWKLKLDKEYKFNCIAFSVNDGDASWYNKNSNCSPCNSIENLKNILSSCTREYVRPHTKGKQTCGLTCRTSDNRVGHITCAFNVDTEKERELYNNLNNLIGTVKTCQEINFTTNKNGKVENGGSVIYLPDLTIQDVTYSHITCNTTIKAVLSSNIIEQYLSNKLEFKLVDIDPTCKQDIIINIDNNIKNVDIQVIDWYNYYIN